MSDVRIPTRIVVARHGHAEYETLEMNGAGGSLTMLGRAQARELGERLRPEKVAVVVCSELSRAVQTAEIAAAAMDVPVRVRERLHEIPMGDYLGQPYNDALFGPMLRSWLAGDLQVGVPGGETGRQTADRMLAVLNDIADEFHGKTVLVVSHGGAIVALWGAIAPGSPEAPVTTANGVGYLFERDANGWRSGPSLRSLPDAVQTLQTG